MIEFPVKMDSIVERINAIQPQAYAQTRNYVSGAVTYLSPYISRGVISTRDIWEALKQKKYKWFEIEKLVQELAWRDYFQWVGITKDINEDIKQPQQGVLHYQTPEAILSASTGIKGIDLAIQELYATGYMHNHCRMYVASVACNLAGAHWKNPAQWMYYHLLDGDWASNACSWQWVAGSNSSKKYYANQQNINKFTNQIQSGTFLDLDAEALPKMKAPAILTTHKSWLPSMDLQEGPLPLLDNTKPLCLYTHYNLDPEWRKNQDVNRVLLLDLNHFKAYPIGPKLLDFIINLAKNIDSIQIYAGSFERLSQHYQGREIYYKEHPLFNHFRGIKEERKWLTPKIQGYYPSFFAFWKKVEKILQSELSDG